VRDDTLPRRFSLPVKADAQSASRNNKTTCLPFSQEIYITKTMSKIDKQDFDNLIKLIFSAKRIFCMGWGMSSFLAEYLSFSLQLLSFKDKR